MPQPSLSVHSAVDAIRIVLASRLPQNPMRTRVGDYCAAYAMPHPKTAGGRLAASNGWIVTSETKLGNYDAVTFVGGFYPATSATCTHRNGNLAIFDGGNLKALAYQRPSKDVEGDAVSKDSLGSADQIDPHRIRLRYGLPQPPFADVVLGNGISIEPVAKKDPVCGGTAVVPNVFGQDIRQARKKLIAYGWLPQKPEEEETGSEYLFPQGVVEVEACSGTGYAFCAFDYRHKKGFGLRVTSMGEEYSVIGFEASCRRS